MLCLKRDPLKTREDFSSLMVRKVQIKMTPKYSLPLKLVKIRKSENTLGMREWRKRGVPR